GAGGRAVGGDAEESERAAVAGDVERLPGSLDVVQSPGRGRGPGEDGAVEGEIRPRRQSRGGERLGRQAVAAAVDAAVEVAGAVVGVVGDRDVVEAVGQ